MDVIAHIFKYLKKAIEENIEPVKLKDHERPQQSYRRMVNTEEKKTEEKTINANEVIEMQEKEKYEKKIVALEKKVSDVSGLLDKMKQFISNRGLGEAFAEFVKSLEPKTMKEHLTEKQKVVKEQTQQKSMHTQEHGTSRKHNISTEL